MFGSNDGQDSDTDCSFLGLFSRLENVSNVHSKADDRKGDDFERRNGDEWRGCADMFCSQGRVTLSVRKHLLELRDIDSFAAEEHSEFARGWRGERLRE